MTEAVSPYVSELLLALTHLAAFAVGWWAARRVTMRAVRVRRTDEGHYALEVRHHDDDDDDPPHIAT